MRTITLEAETPESGRVLYSVLSSFQPDFCVEADGRCFVAVSFGSEKETLEVFDTIQRHLSGRGDPTVIAEKTRARLRLVTPVS